MAAPSGTQWGRIVGGLGKLGIYTEITETATDVAVKVQVWLATKGPCCEDFYRNGSGNLAYKVQAGDGFHKIAYKLGLGTNSGHVIANYNGMSINDTILVGQELLIPTNTFYYNAGPNVTSASNRIGPIYVKHESSTDWSTSNQTCLYEVEDRHNKSASDAVHKVFAKLTDAPYAGGTLSASATYTVQKLKAYTIKFNANDGTGGPSTLTKYHGIGLDIPSTVPTRTGYSFLGWCDSDSYLEGNPLISPGDVYNTDGNVTLTAIWEQVEFTITFDANGGTDAPATQTKCYGTDLSLKDVGVPSKTYHNFLGWSLSPYSTVVKYGPEDTITEDRSVTLYAVWEVSYVIPQIRNAKASRCNADGVLTEEGTYAKVTFDWECYELEDAPGGPNEGQSIKYAYVETGVNTWPDDEDLTVMTINGLSGKADIIIGNDELDIETSYSILVQVHDRVSMSDITLTISDLKFPIDVLARNKGIAFGKSATTPGKMDIAYDVRLFFGKDESGVDICRRLIDLIHPLGSVITLYPNQQDLIKVVSDGKTHYKLTEACAIHPNNVYPGTTWERIAESFLWACDEAGGIGVTGGSETKTLTVANLPAHNHGATYTAAAPASEIKYAWYTAAGEKIGYAEISKGSGEPLNIMPPYVQVAMFRRVG